MSLFAGVFMPILHHELVRWAIFMMGLKVPIKIPSQWELKFCLWNYLFISFILICMWVEFCNSVGPGLALLQAISRSNRTDKVSWLILYCFSYWTAPPVLFLSGTLSKDIFCYTNISLIVLFVLKIIFSKLPYITIIVITFIIFVLNMNFPVIVEFIWFSPQ